MTPPTSRPGSLPETSPGSLPPERLRLGLALALGGLCAVLDTTITVVAAPALIRALDASLSALAWISSAYVLAFVLVIPLAPWLVARFGARRSYLGAVAVFVIGSLLCAAALSPGSLIAARFIQGLGAGLFNPIGMTMAMAGLAPQQRGRMASLLGLAVLIGPVIGPLLAGSILQSWSWRLIFLVAVPPAILCALLIVRWAPPATRQGVVPLDRVGLAMLAPGTVLLMLGISGEGPWLGRLLLSIAGVVVLLTYVRRALTQPSPLVRVALLRRRSVCVPIAALTLFCCVYFGGMTLVPAYLQIARGQSALLTGVLGLGTSIGVGVSLQVSTRLTDRIATRPIVLIGFLLALISTVGSMALLTDSAPFWIVAALGVVLGVGSGAVLMPTQTAVVRHLEGADLSSGAALGVLTSQLATAIGLSSWIAVMSAIAAGTGVITGIRATYGFMSLVLIVGVVLIVVVWPRETAETKDAQEVAKKGSVT